jgi:perosamine synthetase
MGWLDHDRLGFNYRLSDIACALGLAQLSRLDDMLADRARVAAWYREALAGLAAERGPGAAVRGPRGRGAGLVRVRRAAARGRRPRRTVLALREHGVQSKPYLPAIHLMSFYRERFGHRPGEFPVCERVAGASLALPFFPQMTQSQVARVTDAPHPGSRGLT